jgi:serine/threonine protein kinase
MDLQLSDDEFSQKIQEHTCLDEGQYGKVYRLDLPDQRLILKTTNIKEKNGRQVYHRSVKNERDILKKMRGSAHIVQLADCTINKKNKICLEFLGSDLHTLIENYYDNDAHLPLITAKKIIKDILRGLIELKKERVFHGDLKPRNIMLGIDLNDYAIFCKNKREYIGSIMCALRVPHVPHVQTVQTVLANMEVMRELILRSATTKIIDFGGSFTIDPDDPQHGHGLHTKDYVSPEYILRTPIHPNTDLWSVGCIVFEMLTRETLFMPRPDTEMSGRSSLLLQMIDLFGPVPLEFIGRGKRRHYFVDGTNIHKFNYLIKSKSSLRQILRGYPHLAAELDQICDFLGKIFRYEPEQRCSAEELLGHAWLSS